MINEPNWGDPRVQARAKIAIIALVKWLPDEDAQRQLDRNWLNKTLGCSNHLLGAYLRQELLVCTSTYYSKSAKIAKTYRLNVEGANRLLNNLKIQLPIKQFVKKTRIEEYATEFTTGEFQYNDQSDRLFHPTQNIPRSERTELLVHFGYKWHYDIQCCAPSLIYQTALQHGLKSKSMIEKFLSDRTSFRQRLATDYEIPINIIKEILTGIFLGVKFGMNPYTSFYQRINDRVKMYALTQDTELIQLREEIKSVWVCIKKNNPMSLTPKSKSQFYREQERRVLNAAQAFAKRSKIKMYCIHDGWSTSMMLDEYRLKKFVSECTGYEINVDCVRSIDSEYVS